MSDEKYTLWLVGTAALLIDNTLTLQQRQDALDSLLYAQLRANKRSGGRAVDYANWCAVYLQSLDDLGWITLQLHRESVVPETTCSSPLRTLQRWLLALDATLADDLEAAGHALSVKSASAHLARFIHPQANVVHELGVLSSANVLAVCSLHREGGADEEPGGPSVMHQSLRGWVLTVNNAAYAVRREELRVLLEHKGADDYITYVGKLTAGGVNGQV